MPNRVSLRTEHCGNSPFLVSKDGTPGHGEQGSFHFRLLDMTYVADAAEVTGLELLVKIEKKTQFSPSYPLGDGQPLVLKVVCYHSRSIAVGEEEPC